MTAASPLRRVNLVGVAQDLAVSAFHIHPLKRPALKAWFDRSAEYQVLIYWRQDRFVRRLVPDFTYMIAWASQRNIKLISATEDLGDPTEHATMLPAMLKAWLGEGESRSTSARVISTHNHLRHVGRFRGGRVPYGYKAIDNPNGPGRVLALDEGGSADICRELAERVMAGHTVNSVIRLFNERGVPAPQKDRWQAQLARGILRSTALMGPVTPTGERIAPGIVTAEEYDLIQKALEGASVSRTRSRSASPLLGLVFCGVCGGKLYRDRPHKNYKCLGSIMRYEVAEPCTARGVTEEFAEAIVERTLLGTYYEDDLDLTKLEAEVGQPADAE